MKKICLASLALLLICNLPSTSAQAASSCTAGSNTISSVTTDECDLSNTGNSTLDVTNTGGITNNAVAASGNGNAVNTYGATNVSISNAGVLSTIHNSSVYNLYGEITQLTNSNSGSISTSATYYSAITNFAGSVGSLNNYGSIQSTGTGQTGTYNDSAIYNTGFYGLPGTITQIINYGSLLGANGITNEEGTIDSITNKTGGSIVASGFTGQSNRAILNTGTINNLTNESGAVLRTALSATLATVVMNASGVIGTIDNAGTIEALGANSNGIWNSGGSIGSITNQSSGTITASGKGIYNEPNSTITTLTNAGTIDGGDPLATTYGIHNAGTITTLTNTGVISGSWGIRNEGTINTLNNSQSGLLYQGALPTNYNVILGANQSAYGKLIAGLATGSLTFGIHSGSVASKNYSAVLSGITASNIAGGATGTYAGQAYRLALQSGSTDVWDLLFPNWAPPAPPGPDAANTLTSVQMNAGGLSAMYNQQVAAYQAALTYDCRVYDKNNLCASVGGRYTYAGSSASSNQQAGLVVLGYRPVETLRIGAFADQSVNTSTPNGFKQSNNSPMWGLFAKWHMNKDQTGLGVQASAVTSATSLEVTRNQLTNTEAGSGKTQFNGQGYQLSTSYHQPVTNATSVVPYIGLRYTRVNSGAYTENTTADVTAPLSYNAMAQNTFAAIGGIGVKSHLAEKLTGTASVGIQQNLNYSMANYQGTSSISGLNSFSVAMPGNVNSMATASAGVYYDINKNERLGFNVLWQQQPFIATNTTTGLATYTIGF